jgi:hypothetical protein
MISDKLKKIIFDKLYKDLSNVEIIPHEGSVWFIDREEKYWYFEFTKSGELWWRYSFFTNFFHLFSMEYKEFEPIIIEWVEEVLNSKVSTTKLMKQNYFRLVEEVLNNKVSTTIQAQFLLQSRVEEVLNNKVSSTWLNGCNRDEKVGEVLDCTVTETKLGPTSKFYEINKVLSQT